MSYENPCYNCLAPGLSVVFVIDDTGSMSLEIHNATHYSVQIVTQAKVLGSNGPSNYILSTFNDPGLSKNSTSSFFLSFFCSHFLFSMYKQISVAILIYFAITFGFYIDL